jgi:hypothetical protein
MRPILAVLLLAAAAVAAVERDDIFVLRRVHEEFAGEHDRAFEHLTTVLREAQRSSVDATTDLAPFAALLTDDVRYIFHGRGECNGVAQAVGCLAAEEREHAEQQRMAGTSSAAHQTSVMREGNVQVVRTVRAYGNQQWLDVYFVHFSGAQIALLEHLPTVRDPVRLGKAITSCRGNSAPRAACAPTTQS